MDDVEYMQRFRFEIIWTWGCDDVVIYYDGEVIPLEILYFESKESAVRCLKTHGELFLYREKSNPKYSRASYSYQEDTDCYCLTDEQGLHALAVLKSEELAFWNL